MAMASRRLWQNGQYVTFRPLVAQSDVYGHGDRVYLIGSALDVELVQRRCTGAEYGAWDGCLIFQS